MPLIKTHSPYLKQVRNIFNGFLFLLIWCHCSNFLNHITWKTVITTGFSASLSLKFSGKQRFISSRKDYCESSAASGTSLLWGLFTHVTGRSTFVLGNLTLHPSEPTSRSSPSVKRVKGAALTWNAWFTTCTSDCVFLRVLGDTVEAVEFLCH